MKRVILATVTVVAFLATGAGVANASLGVRALGAHLSLVAPDDLSSAVGFGVLVDHGAIAGSWGLESYGGYWKSTEEYFGTEVYVRDVAFGARAKYTFTVGSSKVHPYLGAGLGLHFQEIGLAILPFYYGGTLIPGESVEEDEFNLGVDLGGGMVADIGERTGILTDVWLNMVSNATNFALRLGLVYHIR